MQNIRVGSEQEINLAGVQIMPSFGYNNRAEIRAERESSVSVIWSIYGHEKNGLTEKKQLVLKEPARTF